MSRTHTAVELQADAASSEQNVQRQLGWKLTCVQQATAEQLASWKERAGLAENRLAEAVKEHEQAVAHLSSRCSTHSTQHANDAFHVDHSASGELGL